MARSRRSDRNDGRRPGRRLLAAALVCAALAPGLAAAPVAAAEGAQVRWQDVEKVVAFADVHGAYSELTILLKKAGVVDQDLRWSAGRTHVVSLGDLLDRGADSRKVMDLLMRLQQEAAAAGGQLHVVLGNHEAMNVLGDLRYVDVGEYAAYLPDEDAALRADRREAFLARNPGTTAQDFERLFPPGYFGHRELLGANGRYGQWLLGLPAAIVINDTVYMHGGPSPLLQGMSLEQLDGAYRTALADYLGAEKTLREAGLLQFEDDYGKRPELVEARLAAMADGPDRTALTAVAARFRAADENPLLGPTGPNWYRGAAFCNECAEADVLEPYLQQTGVKRLVIGHTVARNGTVVSRFDGRVIKLDAGMNHAVYKGRPAALVSDASGVRVLYGDDAEPPAEVPAEPLYLSSQRIDETTVEAILANGTIELRETCAPGIVNVVVEAGGRSVNAVFEAASDEVIRHELAAYRLDRLLGLGLVPATVKREHDGEAGILQGRPAEWISEQDRQNARNGTAAGLVCQTITATLQSEPARRPRPSDGKPPRMPTGGWCDLGAEYQLAYAFDALIDNKGRGFDGYLYDADAATLFLSGHAAAFSTSRDVLKPLEPQLAKTGMEMRRRLRALDEAGVSAAVGELLDERQVKALLERRDRVLALSGGGVSSGR